MRRFFGREQAVNTPVHEANRIDAQEQVGDTLFASFLDDNAEAIQKYAAGYSEVGNHMTNMAYDDNLRDRVIDTVDRSNGVWIRNPGFKAELLDSDEVAEMYLANLPVVISYLAKANLSNKDFVGVRAARSLAGNLATGRPPVDEITNGLFSCLAMGKYIYAIYDGLNCAEIKGRQVAGNYGETIIETPRIVEYTHDFYSDGSVNPTDEVFYLGRDFRDILAADILDPKADSLQDALTQIAEDPDTLLDQYAEGLEDGSLDSPIGSMARMALFYAKSKGLDVATTADVLRVTRSEWLQIDPDFERQLASYAVKTAKQYKSTLHRVARIDATGRRNGLRMPVSTLDVQLAVGAFGALLGQKGLGEKHKNMAAKTTTNFSFAQNVLADAEVGGAEARPVSLLKKSMNGYVSVDAEDTSLEDAVIKYAGSNTELDDDVRRMLREISINPFLGKSGKPSYVKTPNGTRMETVDGKKYKVVEFSPQDRIFSLKSGKEGKRTRITYAVTPDGIQVFHIVHHDEFDRIYSSK